MECVYGNVGYQLGGDALAARAAAYRGVWIDIGTGDGRFVRQMAAAAPEWLVIGLDACREQLRGGRRGGPPNQLLVAANALAMPAELGGMARRLSVNFPWGSLLAGLVEGDRRLLGGLAALARPEALLELIPGMLQHASEEMGERHYNLARSVEASRRYAGHLAKTRSRLRPLSRRTRD